MDSHFNRAILYLNQANELEKHECYYTTYVALNPLEKKIGHCYTKYTSVKYNIINGKESKLAPELISCTFHIEKELLAHLFLAVPIFFLRISLYEGWLCMPVQQKYLTFPIYPLYIVSMFSFSLHSIWVISFLLPKKEQNLFYICLYIIMYLSLVVHNSAILSALAKFYE